jgi:hypothetical protein
MKCKMCNIVDVPKRINGRGNQTKFCETCRQQKERLYRRKWQVQNKDKVRTYNLTWKNNHKEQHNDIKNKFWKKYYPKYYSDIKNEVMRHYSNGDMKCAICGSVIN